MACSISLIFYVSLLYVEKKLSLRGLLWTTAWPWVGTCQFGACNYHFGERWKYDEMDFPKSSRWQYPEYGSCALLCGPELGQNLFPAVPSKYLDAIILGNRGAGISLTLCAFMLSSNSAVLWLLVTFFHFWFSILVVLLLLFSHYCHPSLLFVGFWQDVSPGFHAYYISTAASVFVQWPSSIFLISCSTSDVNASFNIGRVIAYRCHQVGIDSMIFDHSKEGEAVSLYSWNS